MADDAPAPKKRKKTSPWFEAAQQLPQLPPGIPPKSKDVSTAQRDARLTLVRQFWPGVAGAGGRDTCRECRFPPPGGTRHPWGACRGRGAGTRNAHGPDVPDWPALEYPVGCHVQCTGFKGVVTAFDEVSGFFTVTCNDGAVREVFLSHASYNTAVGARNPRSGRAVQLRKRGPPALTISAHAVAAAAPSPPKPKKPKKTAQKPAATNTPAAKGKAPDAAAYAAKKGAKGGRGAAPAAKGGKAAAPKPPPASGPRRSARGN